MCSLGDICNILCGAVCSAATVSSCHQPESCLDAIYLPRISTASFIPVYHHSAVAKVQFIWLKLKYKILLFYWTISFSFKAVQKFYCNMSWNENLFYAILSVVTQNDWLLSQCYIITITEPFPPSLDNRPQLILFWSIQDILTLQRVTECPLKKWHWQHKIEEYR